ncbi:NAD(P)-dependent oxidoreductase [Mariniblastus sp.]|nr:NAD(P)-dependent oxidoreductase [Mariniblastus sp.]
MKVAVTGATGFVGTALLNRFHHAGIQSRCWTRGNLPGIPVHQEGVEWLTGELSDKQSMENLVQGCDAVVHSGLARSGRSFQANELDVVEYARVNILGTLELIETARAAGVKRFVFVSTCAVHDHILSDRPLDEAHPLWANTHYGAQKAAIEKFVHSYGLGCGFPICAIRPTGIYGAANPLENSKWFKLIESIVRGVDVEVNSGGKEVHVDDVARAIELLLVSDGIEGQSYSCYDRYISEFDVANVAKQICNSASSIIGEQKRPKHEIDVTKIKDLGMEFGGAERLYETVESLVKQIQRR